MADLPLGCRAGKPGFVAVCGRNAGALCVCLFGKNQACCPLLFGRFADLLRLPKQRRAGGNRRGVAEDVEEIRKGKVRIISANREGA